MDDACFAVLFRHDEALHPTADRLRMLAFELAVKYSGDDEPPADLVAKVWLLVLNTEGIVCKLSPAARLALDSRVSTSRCVARWGCRCRCRIALRARIVRPELGACIMAAC